MAGRHHDAEKGFRVEGFEDGAGGAAVCAAPVMLFGDEALQPGEGAAGGTAEGELEVDDGAGGGGTAWISGLRLVVDCLRGEGGGLGADLEEGEEEGVQDVAVEDEGLLTGLAEGDVGCAKSRCRLVSSC